jgi:hypothetical protein
VKRRVLVLLPMLGCTSVRLPAAAPFWASSRASTAGELVLRCSPTDAEVALDGVSQGVCTDFNGEPNALKVGGQTRRVEVKKSGFAPWQTWLAADRTRVVVSVTLLPNGGSP